MSAFHLDPNSSARERHLRLSGEVTIEHARDLHAALVTAVAKGITLHIDAGAVSRIDAAVLQVLLAADRAAARTEISAASAAWTHALQRFGFTDLKN